MEGNGPHVRVGLSLRVLVVEDDDDTATSLATLLQTYGYEVEVATDGASACQAIHASLPDVVLLDIGLPKMNGWLVAKQIREQSTWKRPLIIAVTGHGREADRLRSQEAGIDLHLIKPVDPEELHRLLSRFQSIVNVPGDKLCRLKS
jgi:DNA-binding response OmpR family regulator